MTEIQVQALDRAVKLLRAAGCQYAIVDPTGTKHGELELAEVKERRRIQKRPRGEFKSYFAPHLEAIKPSSDGLIPYGPYTSDEDRSALRGAVASHCSAHWGLGSYMSTMGKDGIELLRME